MLVGSNVQEGELQISGTNFTRNTANMEGNQGLGGAVYAAQVSSAELSDSSFMGNSAGSGGGIMLSVGCTTL